VKTDIFRPADDDGLDVYDEREMEKKATQETELEETSKLPSHISQTPSPCAF
jgi:hypothetical protein